MKTQEATTTAANKPARAKSKAAKGEGGPKDSAAKAAKGPKTAKTEGNVHEERRREQTDRGVP